MRKEGQVDANIKGPQDAQELKLLPMDSGTIQRIPRFYAQNVVLSVTPEETSMTFCARIQVGDPGDESELLVPQAICYLSTAHFRRLAKLIAEQVADVDKLVESRFQAYLRNIEKKESK